MRVLRGQRSAPDEELKFWESRGRALTPQAYQQLSASPLRSKPLKLQRVPAPSHVHDLFARLIGVKRGPQLMLTLMLGRQVISKSLIRELLTIPSAHQRHLDHFLTYHTGSVIKAQHSPRSKGLWSTKRQTVMLNKQVSEFYVSDAYGEVFNGNILAAAVAVIRIQSKLLDLAHKYRLDHRRFLACFSEHIRHPREPDAQARTQVSRRLEALRALVESEHGFIPYRSLYRPEDGGKAAMIDLLLKPLEHLNIVTSFQGFSEYLPSQGFLKLREAFRAEREPDVILMNAKANTSTSIFFDYIKSLDQPSYHISQICVHTGLSRLEVQKIHSRLNLHFGFDFLSQDGGETYKFTRRPHVVTIEKRKPGEKKPRTSVAIQVEQRAKQRYIVNALGESLDVLGSWRVEDFQRVVDGMWHTFYPDRYDASGNLLADFKTQWTNEYDALRLAYSQKRSISAYQPSQVYVKITDEGEPLVRDLLEAWSVGRDIYQRFFDDPELLTHYFGGPLQLERPISEWPQSELLGRASKILSRMEPDTTRDD